jgi:hypothetical protein
MVHVDMYAIFAETARLIHDDRLSLTSRGLEGSAESGEKRMPRVDEGSEELL